MPPTRDRERIDATRALRSDASGPGGYSLSIDDFSRVKVRVAIDPFQSVMAELRHMAQRCERRPNPPPATRIRPKARFALDAFSHTNFSFVPDSCLQIGWRTEPSVESKVQSLRELRTSALVDEVDAACACAGSDPHGDWRRVAADPRRWLDALADAAEDTWAQFQPQWSSASPVIEREVRRIGAAVVRGTLPALLNTLHPRLTYSDGSLVCASQSDEAFDLADRPLVLLPMLANRSAAIISFDRPDAVYVGYPVRSGSGASSHINDLSSLAQMIGPVRAAALCLLHTPMTIGDLAKGLNCGSSSVTYHCGQLLSAGLIHREQQGRLVWLSRTARGDNLVSMCDGR